MSIEYSKKNSYVSFRGISIINIKYSQKNNLTISGVKMKHLFLILFLIFSFSAFGQHNSPFATNNAFTQFDSSYITKLKKFNMSAPYTLVNVGTPNNQILMSMGFGAPGYLYVIYCPQSYNFMLYRMDTTNATTTQISSSSLYLNGSINRGLSWDKTTNTMYTIFAYSPGKIYTVNLSTGVFTYVVDTQAPNYFVGFAINNAGSMYGISSIGNKLIRINKMTGAITEIGLINISTLNVKGCDFDPITGKMYMMNGNGSNTDVYLIDTASGTTTLSGTISGSVEWIAIAGKTYIGIKPIGTEVPNEFSLQQNYPNPFNPSTKIKFQVASSKFVKLVVYDILGKEIATLVNENLKAGLYEVPFSISQFSENQIPSGIYYYRLTAGDFNETKSMVLIK